MVPDEPQAYALAVLRKPARAFLHLGTPSRHSRWRTGPAHGPVLRATEPRRDTPAGFHFLAMAMSGARHSTFLERSFCWRVGALADTRTRRRQLRVLATRYRTRAQECLEDARTSVGEKMILLLDMAQTWLRLAQEEEGSFIVEQPSTQQQQQIQPRDDEPG